MCCRSLKSRVYEYVNRLTPGLTEVRSYVAFLTSFSDEGLPVRFRAIPALKTASGVRPFMPRPWCGRRRL